MLNNEYPQQSSDPKHEFFDFDDEEHPVIAPGREAQRTKKVAVKPQLRLVDVSTLMERPFFALAGKPVPALPPYVSPNGDLRLHVQSQQPQIGVATLRDAEVLIILISMMNDRRIGTAPITNPITLPTRMLLRLADRAVGGRQYKLLKHSLERLRLTCLTTNIGPTGKAAENQTFSLLSDWSKHGDGMLSLTASDWLVAAVHAGSVLRLTDSYFSLRPGYETWLYRVARKHAGEQVDGFTMRVSTLWRKSGSTSRLDRFRFELKRIVMDDGLPDYRLEWIEESSGHEAKVEMRSEPGRNARGINHRIHPQKRPLAVPDDEVPF